MGRLMLVLIGVWALCLPTAHAGPEIVKDFASIKQSLHQEPNLPATGPKKAPIVMVEFFDYACPHCREMYPPLHEVLLHNPHVRVVYRHLPLLGPNSKIMAKAALAAGKQGQFEAMHTWLMTEGYDDTLPAIEEYAVHTLHLNPQKFKQDMAGMELEKVMDHTIEHALKMNIRTVPALLINDHVFHGALSPEDFQQHLKEVHPLR